MPTYGKDNFKESNVNYLNKDFLSIKESLINYAKSYFPDTYRDFNETSPGMMLLEMNAYVGDVLSFYIDQQYREMLLPLAEERRNIINMAKMFGYKVKPIIPSHVNLTFTSDVNSHRTDGDASKVNYANAGVFDAGIEVASSTDPNMKFTTLEPVDFTITGSGNIDTNVVASTDTATGLVDKYRLERAVKAISATQKTATFKIGAPEKFKKITISDTNVIDIVSCIDSNGSEWYEVDFLAQDKIPISKHWTEDDRTSAYFNQTTGEEETSPVPYSLSYITSTKRFTRETNLDNTTSLIFGNGVLKNGEMVDENYIDMEQLGVVIPGQYGDLNESIDQLQNNEYSTLGETPNNTTLTITYRVGGGVDSNVPAGQITTLPSVTPSGGDTSATLVDVINRQTARGGKDSEDTVEIQEKTKAFFATQNRCVTKEDYEARVLNMTSKYGAIAKVYVTRSEESATEDEYDSQIAAIQSLTDSVLTYQLLLEGALDSPDDLGTLESLKQTIGSAQSSGFIPDLSNAVNDLPANLIINNNNFATIDIYVLGYNNQKQLVGNPHTETTLTIDNLSDMLTGNIQAYLDNFSILTDTYTINDGYIVNFGVIFDVIAEKYANKQQVKLNCIQKIQDYFRIENMQFNQPIYKSELEFQLMGVEGVRSIGHVTITQKTDYFSYGGEGDFASQGFTDATFLYSFNSQDGEYQQDSENGTIGYGYYYDFENALSEDGTIILPPTTDTPTVFELKNPNTNIQGRVR
jgi:hypothetical protein